MAKTCTAITSTDTSKYFSRYPVGTAGCRTKWMTAWWISDGASVVVAMLAKYLYAGTAVSADTSVSAGSSGAALISAVAPGSGVILERNSF
jgi:hypothetical protein